MKHRKNTSPKDAAGVPDKGDIERATGSQGGQSDKSESGFISAERNEAEEHKDEARKKG